MKKNTEKYMTMITYENTRDFLTIKFLWALIPKQITYKQVFGT